MLDFKSVIENPGWITTVTQVPVRWNSLKHVPNCKDASGYADGGGSRPVLHQCFATLADFIQHLGLLSQLRFPKPG